MLDCVHDCWDKIFKHSIERKSLINNMTAVILVIDELVDQGIIMSTDPNTILKRINIKGALGSVGAGGSSEGNTESASSQGSTAQSSGGGGMFASVFASAKSQLAKTLAL